MKVVSLRSKVVAVVWSSIFVSLISLFGAGVWTALIGANLATSPAIPWSVPSMALVLWALWRYLGGKWWPGTTSETRRTYLRANRPPRKVFLWALLASVLSVIALAGYWIVLVELVGVGGNPTIPDYSLYPRLTVVVGLIMGSLVSPLTEEAAFRGYAQVRLERVFSPWLAIVIASIMFSLWHGPTQGFFWSKLLFYFVVGVAFGTTAYLTHSSLSAIPAHILGGMTFFFLIWPNDAVRPLIWRDGANTGFWVCVVQAILFTILSALAFRRLAREAGMHRPVKSSSFAR